MYQALYRKYRPNSFDEVYGQEVIVKTLKNAILNDKISHAYLFTGPRGTGKTSVAKIFGKTINCLDAKNAIPCGECVNCLQIENKQTTDIIEIDAASNNGVEEIRELKSKVNLVPSTGKYKVYIIDEVHMLTVGAFNALLKTLEEPPSHIIFVMATTEPHKIPTTILSRCQKFDFKKIGINTIYDRLKYICDEEKIAIENNALLELSRLSEGGMRDAISMLDQVVAYTNDLITEKDIHEVNGTISQMGLTKFVGYVVEKDIVNCLNLIDDYYEKGKNLLKLVEEIMLYLKNVLLYVTVPKYFDNLDIDTTPYAEIGNKIDKNLILEMIESLNDLVLGMKNNVNQKLLMELAFIQVISKDREQNNVKSEQNVALQQQIKSRIKLEKVEKKEIKNVPFNKRNVNEEKLSKLVEIRVNNALVSPNTNYILDIQNKINNLHSLIVNITYGQLPSLILDGRIKAATEKYVIFVYETIGAVKMFNENLDEIEKIVFEVLNLEIKPVALKTADWDNIKSEFRKKSKKYELIEEKCNYNEIYFNDTSDIKDLFGSIVEIK